MRPAKRRRTRGLGQESGSYSVTSMFVLPPPTRKRMIKAPPWSGPGVSVVERRARSTGIGALGAVNAWIGHWLQQRQAVKDRRGGFVVGTELVPALAFEDARTLLRWWHDRLAEADVIGTLRRKDTATWTTATWLENFSYVVDDEDYEWTQEFVIFSWRLMHQAAAHLDAILAVRRHEAENTILRAIRESVADIVDPNAPDPFGVGKLFRKIAIGGAVVIGSLLALEIVRRLPERRREPQP